MLALMSNKEQQTEQLKQALQILANAAAAASLPMRDHEMCQQAGKIILNHIDGEEVVTPEIVMPNDE